MLLVRGQYSFSNVVNSSILLRLPQYASLGAFTLYCTIGASTIRLTVSYHSTPHWEHSHYASLGASTIRPNKLPQYASLGVLTICLPGSFHNTPHCNLPQYILLGATQYGSLCATTMPLTGSSQHMHH